VSSVLLSLEFLDEWDVLIIYQLDRGFRNHLDFVTFYHEFCERYGKKIISVGEEGLDMSTPMGRMFAGILVQFAEWELQSIGERRRQGQNVLRREARWGGGRYPFGCEPYQAGARTGTSARTRCTPGKSSGWPWRLFPGGRPGA
jgi:site-specific DNA recombinase